MLLLNSMADLACFARLAASSRFVSRGVLPLFFAEQQCAAGRRTRRFARLKNNDVVIAVWGLGNYSTSKPTLSI